MSGAEDLVPVLDDDGGPMVLPDVAGYAITRYRPRTEGSFARIERWQSRTQPAEVYWRTTTKDNVTSIYGQSPAAHLSDRDHPQHTYQWQLEETFDAKGNHILYEYIRENPALHLPGSTNIIAAIRSCICGAFCTATRQIACLPLRKSDRSAPPPSIWIRRAPGAAITSSKCCSTTVTSRNRCRFTPKTAPRPPGGTAATMIYPAGPRARIRFQPSGPVLNYAPCAFVNEC